MAHKESKLKQMGSVLAQELGTELKTSVLDDKNRDWQLMQLPIEAIVANPNQPRKEFNEVSIRELANSIEKNGLLQPLVARPMKDGQFELIAGERRLRALKILERGTAPIIIRNTEDPSELSLIENIQREDLNPIDLAESLKQLKIMREMTDEELGRLLGKSRTWVTESMSIATLDPDVMQKAKEKNLSRSLLIEMARDKNKIAPILAEAVKPTVRAARESKNGGTLKKKYRFFYHPEGGAFAVIVQFTSKTKATKDEVRQALKEAANSLGRSA